MLRECSDVITMYLRQRETEQKRCFHEGSHRPHRELARCPAAQDAETFYDGVGANSRMSIRTPESAASSAILMSCRETSSST